MVEVDVCFLVPDDGVLEFCGWGWRQSYIEGTLYTVNESVGAQHVLCGEGKVQLLENAASLFGQMGKSRSDVRQCNV